ncbi:hypothetical protein N9T98_00985, partial [bacterium]|nr:hypothetical protein [bacterium]
RKEVQQLPVINALTSTPSYRDVRVHDDFRFAPAKDGQLCKTDNDTIKGSGLYVACLLDPAKLGLAPVINALGDGNLEETVNRANEIVKYCTRYQLNQSVIRECVKRELNQ